MRRRITTLLAWGTFIALVIVVAVAYRWIRSYQTPRLIPRTALARAANQGDSLPPRARDFASPAHAFRRTIRSEGQAPLYPFQAINAVGEAFDYIRHYRCTQAVAYRADVATTPRSPIRTAEEIDYTDRPQEEGDFPRRSLGTERRGRYGT
jgi:hypothetical protein